MTGAFIEATESLIAVAADNLSWGANKKAIAVEKTLVLDGRIGVSSYGCDTDRVPAALKSPTLRMTGSKTRPKLSPRHDVIAQCRFGLNVAGIDGGNSQVWHIDVPSNARPRRDYTGPRASSGWMCCYVAPMMQVAAQGLLDTQLGRFECRAVFRGDPVWICADAYLLKLPFYSMRRLSAVSPIRHVSEALNLLVVGSSPTRPTN
jgi:hypothetical protein